jgi:diguanylate cyclase (GGDEF)-like protein
MHSHLKRLARTDELTGLCNRRTLLEELDWRLAHQRRHRRCGALLYVDLDNFKAVNDCFGHGRGDALLRAFADRLGGAVRLGDLAARIGGDEFAVWLEEIDAAGAARVAERIAAFAPELDREHGAPDRSFGVSVGVAISDPEADETPTALLARADRAMYAAKARGKAVATAGSPQDGG